MVEPESLHRQGLATANQPAGCSSGNRVGSLLWRSILDSNADNINLIAIPLFFLDYHPAILVGLENLMGIELHLCVLNRIALFIVEKKRDSRRLRELIFIAEDRCPGCAVTTFSPLTAVFLMLLVRVSQVTFPDEYIFPLLEKLNKYDANSFLINS
ncbi:MAG: hypothetical protein ACOCW2_03755 [Chitinivibrionales bacterium]